MCYLQPEGGDRVSLEKNLTLLSLHFCFPPAVNKVQLSAKRQEFDHHFLKISGPALKDHSAKILLDNIVLLLLFLTQCGTNNKKDEGIKSKCVVFFFFFTPSSCLLILLDSSRVDTRFKTNQQKR